MSRTLHELQAMIGAATRSDPERQMSRDRVIARARLLAATLPLVHRTAWPGQPRDWRQILAAAPPLITPSGHITSEERAAGLPRAAYFFFGCSAFDKGNVAFLLNTAVLAGRTSSFTPFDTGALWSRVRIARSPPGEDGDVQQAAAELILQGVGGAP